MLVSAVIVQVTKCHQNDKDANAKYNECRKIVNRLAFEKAIAVEDQQPISEQLDLANMCEHFFLLFLIFFLAKLNYVIRSKATSPSIMPEEKFRVTGKSHGISYSWSLSFYRINS